MRNAEELEEQYYGNANKGDIVSYASLFCTRILDENLRRELVYGLSNALESANAMASIHLTCVMLKNLSDWYGSFEKRDENPLAELEGIGLTAIVEHGAWNLDGGTFVNYTNAVAGFGLPDHKEIFEMWINSPVSRQGL